MLLLIFAGMTYQLLVVGRVQAASSVDTPVDEIVLAGDSVQFNCSVEGQQPGQILRWIKGTVAFSRDYSVSSVSGITDSDRTSIVGDTNGNVSSYNLRIRDVVAADSASYLCGLEQGSSYVFVSEAAKLTVIGGPECMLEGNSVTEGKWTNLTCQATKSDPPVALSWKAAPSGQSQSQVWSDNNNVYNHLYWIPSRNDKNTVFICEMALPGESRKEICSMGPVDIQYGPVVDVTPSLHTVAVSGETITFDCNVDSNPPAYTFTWTVNNVAIQPVPGSVVLQNTGQSLQILISDDEYDGAVITCTAFNAVGSGRAESRVFVNLLKTTSGYDSKGAGNDSTSTLSRLNISIIAGIASAVVILTISGSILVAYFVKSRHRVINRKARKRHYGEGFDLGNRSVVNPIANVEGEAVSNVALHDADKSKGTNAEDGLTNLGNESNVTIPSYNGKPSHYDVPRKLSVPPQYDIYAEGASSTKDDRTASENQYDSLANARSGNTKDIQDEPWKKNAEGLVYADLELAKPTDKDNGGQSNLIPKSESTVYAQIQIKQ